ncbi:MAG TPA: alcohol dehydrogenase catalytic domain-containing protein, partial [Anaerolineales bacterium]|nr:alcohol dehydrogenase catalytic domain-containing protein [Anaerolineales bacterium]
MMLGKAMPSFLWSGLSCTYQAEITEPALPNAEWVKVKTRYGGICGTDIGTIHLRTSPYFSPYSSFPFTLGHENTGTIAEVGAEAGDWQVGERVVIEPHLWCRPRGFKDLCEYCARGETKLCKHFREGTLAPGILTGACRDTGGSWSSHFVAHSSQIYRVPEQVTDENALMVEPFSVGLHAALQFWPGDHKRVLIQGAGTIGLVTLAALRTLGSKANITLLARYPFQKEAGERLGASEVILTKGVDIFHSIAQKTGGQVLKPIIGKNVLEGGFDHTFECVGNDASIDDVLRFTRSGGTVVLLGVPGIAKGIDWTPIFAKELSVYASNTYNRAERYQGQTWEAFELTLDLMARGVLDLGWMITHRYRLDHFDRAMKEIGKRGNTGIIKAVFEF